MILVSNNLQNHMDLPKDVVIRINMAWIKRLSDLEVVVIKNRNRKVFLDYPQGRSKPPRPVLTLEDAYKMIYAYSQTIKYFAMSNVEDSKKVLEVQSKLPSCVEFVPKIETEKGVENLVTLIESCNIKTIMLDKEDLFVDVEEDNTCFYRNIDKVREICHKMNVCLLELQGVTFIG